MGGVALCLLLFELTPVDLWLQGHFYDLNARQWIWDRSEPVKHLIFYDGIRVLLIAVGSGLLLSLAFIRHSVTIRAYRDGICIVLLSLVLVPACVGVLKNTTNVACPRDLVQFGGNIEYVGITGSYPANKTPLKTQKCFPAGHASGGFALLSLCFLFKSAGNRRRALCLVLLTGWMMGIYKMLIGDHFLSHTVTSMALSWLIIHLIVLANDRIFSADWVDSASDIQLQ